VTRKRVPSKKRSNIGWLSYPLKRLRKRRFLGPFFATVFWRVLSPPQLGQLLPYLASMKLLFLPFELWLGHGTMKAPAIELKGYFSCMSSLLLPQQKAALTCYAQTQRHCQNGTVILAYEKFRTLPSVLPQPQIVDTVQLHITPQHYLTIATCTTPKGKATQYFVLCRQDALDKKHLRNVLRVWGVNPKEQLVEVPVKAVTCLNDDFGA
jgi:hypothetical protein